MNPKVILALLLPFLALGLQLCLWPWVSPFVWFLFYPASYFSARLGGFWTGIVSTVLSIGMVWYFFMVPRFSWMIASPSNIYSAAAFLLMGLLFSLSQEQIRRALMGTESRFQAAFEQAAVGMALITPEGNWFKVNQRFCEIVGYSPEEILAHSIREIRPSGDPESDQEIFRKLFNQEVPSLSKEKSFIRKDGSVGWMHRRLAAQWKPNGKPDFIIAVVEDITERRRIQEDLHESETRLQLLIDHAPASMAMFDREMRYLAVSRRWRDDFSLGDQEILGCSHYEIFPEIPERWREIHRRGMAGETVRAGEDGFDRMDGTVQWLRWEVLPWRASDGGVGGIVIFSEDITERVSAGMALKESEERYRSLFRSNHSVALLIDPESGAIVDTNPAAAQFYGWSEEELRRKNIREINTLPPSEIAKVLGLSKGGSQHFYFQHRIADGSVRDVEVFSGPIMLKDRKLNYSFIHDVTDRRKAEDALRESKAKLEAALESIQDAVFISDAEGRFIEFNEAFATFHKFKNKGECAKTFAEYPDILDVYFNNGELAPVSQWAVPRALRGEVVSYAEYALRRKDTGERWVGSYSFAPIRDEDGTIVGSVVVGRDITDRKRMEEELHRLNVDLEQRVLERTAELQAANTELDSFAYAVSHDLRAPLRAMNGFSHALVEDLGPKLQAEEKTYLDQIIAASARMSALIDGILRLSRTTRSELKREWLDLTSMAGNILREFKSTEPDRDVEWVVTPGIRAWGDASLLEAVLRNLLGNAWKYSAGSRPARIYFEKESGRFTVEDNGAGFDMAYATKLFQPFQRLHRQDEFPGIGIGLATVQRIIHRHGGQIEAHSEPGKGATFSFTLPEHQEHSV